MFRPNPRFIAELKKEPGVKAEFQAAAKTVAGIARGITPHAPSSITTDASGDTVTVGSDDPVFHLVEWGSVNNPPYAPIRRAVRAAGLRLEETGP